MSQEAREHRRLIRQRGAGARELKAASFGFSFGMAVPPPSTAAAPVGIVAGVGLRARSATVDVPNIALMDDEPEREKAEEGSQKTRTVRKGTGKRKRDVELASAPSDVPKQKSEPRKRGRPRKAEVQKKVVEEEVPRSSNRTKIVIAEEESVSAEPVDVPKPAARRRKNTTQSKDVGEPFRKCQSTVVAETEQVLIVAASPAPIPTRKRGRSGAVKVDEDTAPVVRDDASIKGVGKRKQQTAKKSVSTNAHRKNVDVTTSGDAHCAAGKQPTANTALSDHEHNPIECDHERSVKVNEVIAKQGSELQPSRKAPQKRQHRELGTEQDAHEDSVKLLHRNETCSDGFPSSRIDAGTHAAIRLSGDSNEPQRKRRPKKKVATPESPIQPLTKTKSCNPAIIYDEESIQQHEMSTNHGNGRKEQRDESAPVVKSAKTGTKTKQETYEASRRAQVPKACPALVERSLNHQFQRPGGARKTSVRDEDEDEGDLGAILKRYGAPKIPSTLAMASDPRLKFRF